MPFLFKMQVKQSNIHGRGLFAYEDIPKGSTFWVYQTSTEFIPVVGYEEARQNLAYNQNELQSMKDEKKLSQILHGGCYCENSDLYIELRDGTNFINHSEDFSSVLLFDAKDHRKMYSYAAKDIKAGDEIVEDYSNYSSSSREWINRLYAKYIPDRKEIETEALAEVNLDKKKAIA